MKVPTGVKLTDMSTAWGLVQVFAKDGSIEREFAITAKEADAVVQGNNVIPSGVTEDEWFSGRVTVACRPCNPGEAVINPDGTLVVNYGVTEKNARIDVKLMQLQPTEFIKDAGDVLHIDAAIAAQVDVPMVAVKPDLVP